MSEFNPKFLSPAELDLIQEITVQAIDNGLAGRYSNQLDKEIAGVDRWTEDLTTRADDQGVVGGVTLSSLLVLAEGKKKDLQRARSGEYGFVFDAEPSNLSKSVMMRRIWGNKRLIFTASTVHLGLVDGLAGEGKPNGDFTVDDLKFAIQSADRMTQLSHSI